MDRCLTLRRSARRHTPGGQLLALHFCQPRFQSLALHIGSKHSALSRVAQMIPFYFLLPTPHPQQKYSAAKGSSLELCSSPVP